MPEAQPPTGTILACKRTRFDPRMRTRRQGHGFDEGGESAIIPARRVGSDEHDRGGMVDESGGHLDECGQILLDRKRLPIRSVAPRGWVENDSAESLASAREPRHEGRTIVVDPADRRPGKFARRGVVTSRSDRLSGGVNVRDAAARRGRGERGDTGVREERENPIARLEDSRQPAGDLDVFEKQPDLSGGRGPKVQHE